MRAVFKYEFSRHQGLNVSIVMPRDSNILCVHHQNGNIFLWADVIADKDASCVRAVLRKFKLVLTGDPVPDGKYIGTVFIPEPYEVVHVYEVTR